MRFIRTLAVATLATLAMSVPVTASDVPVAIGDYGNGAPSVLDVQTCPGQIIYYPTGLDDVTGGAWRCEHRVAFTRSPGASVGVWTVDGDVVGYAANEDDTAMIRVPSFPR